ncbi:class I SAM-dependent methyltransferase [Mesorhizobium escarrei]|uniref:Methyltranfer_dom domain-containing protein n=1 Tax=Mesorhizobium escarrei TaxID=666018 RepID=A0ABN8KBW0_9HYPH|nr:class I SAM-dependent methyltransferase [Mesorhizobium escarrei]CAH2407058.1 Methyltranfer_dom domain-containing protein [Mesorhizobium escarrei]
MANDETENASPRQPANVYPFPVYLSEKELSDSDEYAGGDPYSVETTHTRSSFHQRRFDLTLDLLRGLGHLDRILDVGCGEGHITAEIKRQFPKAEVHGLDYSLSAIRKAHLAYPDISFSVADAVKSPYPKGKFDVVVCNNLWEHVTDPIGLLLRMKDVLKPGGSVIISTPSRYRTANLVRAILGRKIVFMSKYHVTEYTVGQVKEQLAYGGFDVIRVLSRPISAGSIKLRLVQKALSAWRAATGSHHELEETIFYLAKWTRNNAHQSDI